MWHTARSGCENRRSNCFSGIGCGSSSSSSSNSGGSSNSCTSITSSRMCGILRVHDLRVGGVTVVVVVVVAVVLVVSIVV